MVAYNHMFLKKAEHALRPASHETFASWQENFPADARTQTPSAVRYDRSTSASTIADYLTPYFNLRPASNSI